MTHLGSLATEESTHDEHDGDRAGRSRLRADHGRDPAAPEPDRDGPHDPKPGACDTVEDDYTTTYPLLVSELNGLGLAYLHLVEAGDPALTPVIRRVWDGALILNAAIPDPLDHPSRLDLVTDGAADLVSFGRLFIANPDLVARLAGGAELALPDMTKAYGGDRAGYTDYPPLADTLPVL
ncbi:hypothetical protein [Microtetraspora malaysiensis]|uniref:hypothetical protein n=1 Tax=Microtetraspora malaysiensis TaxID=161358 RepID=UPI003D8D0FCB